MKKILFLLTLIWLPLFGQPPIAVYLTLPEDPLTGVNIQWISNPPIEENFVELRQEEGTEWIRIPAKFRLMPQKNKELVHVAELRGLKAGANYTFRIGEDTQELKFRTLPDDPKAPIRFVVGGDVLHDSIAIFKEINEKAAATDPHFALIGGDIAYAAHKSLWRAQNHQAWMDFVITWSQSMVTPDGFLIPIVPVLGNHDVTGRYGQPKDRAIYYYTLFTTPGQRGYFALDFGNRMSIFGLDSGHTNEIGGEQAQWLKKSLEERENVPFKFALYHVPAYPSVRPYSNKRCVPIRRHWVPLFEQYHLTAAFEHHDHAYKRTHPIYQGKVEKEGVLYLGDGAWGVEVPRKPKTPEELWYLAKSSPTRHFILVNVGEKEASFSAIDANGDIFDKTVVEPKIPALKGICESPVLCH